MYVCVSILSCWTLTVTVTVKLMFVKIDSPPSTELLPYTNYSNPWQGGRGVTSQIYKTPNLVKQEQEQSVIFHLHSRIITGAAAQSNYLLVKRVQSLIGFVMSCFEQFHRCVQTVEGLQKKKASTWWVEIENLNFCRSFKISKSQPRLWFNCLRYRLSTYFCSTMKIWLKDGFHISWRLQDVERQLLY